MTVSITRRAALVGVSGLATASAFRARAASDVAPKDLRIGFQKAGLPVIARKQESIETRLKPAGTSVRWVEFTAGPPLLEAMNAGAVDVGWTGDAPPIFAQAAGMAIVYVAALPSNGAGEAMIVKANSPIKDLGDLKGRKVGMTKGSSSHNLTVAALEKAGVAWGDITPIYLSPADAAAAFGRGAVDAWTIWDPFLAIAESREPTRQLVNSRDTLDVKTFFLANKDFALRNAHTLDAVLGSLGEAADWASGHRDAVARSLAEVTGVDIAAQTVAADRAEFGIGPITDEIIRNQQATADRFHRLGLVPREIAVKDAVWTRPQS